MSSSLRLSLFSSFNWFLGSCFVLISSYFLILHIQVRHWGNKPYKIKLHLGPTQNFLLLGTSNELKIKTYYLTRQSYQRIGFLLKCKNLLQSFWSMWNSSIYMFGIGWKSPPNGATIVCYYPYFKVWWENVVNMLCKLH